MGSNDRLEKLKRLQAAKKGYRFSDNGSITDFVEEDDDRIYDEIDEAEYKKRRRQELLQDDFVVDDDGVGYVDRGVEDDWQNDNYYSSEDFDDSDENSNRLKRKKNGKTSKDGNEIGQMLRLQQQRKKNISVSLNNSTNKKTIAIDDFDDILGEFDKMTPQPISAVSSSSINRLPSSPTLKRKLNDPRIHNNNANENRLKSNSSMSNIVVKRPKTEDSSMVTAQEIQLDSSPL